MRTSIATVSVSGTLERKLEAIAAAGFDGVEIFENDLIASPTPPERIRAVAADLGLRIEMYQPMRDVEAMPADRFADTLRRAERKFELMERLGTDLLLVCSNVSPHAVADDALAAEQLHRLADRAAAHGIRIAYEALAWGRHVNEYLHAWRIVRAADHPNLGTCLDSFHILSRGSDPAGIEAIPGEKIFFLQLADAPRLAMDVLQWSRHYRCFPGQGDFDVAGLVEYVLRAGYTGPLSLEVFNDDFRQAEVRRTAVDGMRSLLMLQEQLAARLGTSVPVPQAAPPSGFAFVELAVPGDRDAELKPLLGALGFARTGQHRTKPVELWEAGAARVLLNAADDGDAVRLAAVALESDDPDASLARARALCSPALPRQRQQGEADITAIAAPDGTEAFFCAAGRSGRADWLADFVAAADSAPASPSASGRVVSHIDHVALTQPRHHFDEALLFYRAVLGLEPQTPLAEFADPHGLIRSRAIAGPDRSVRLALNMADVAEPDVPLRHIALASDDILAAAAAVRAVPGAQLPIPANYHDDLEARHDLGADRLRALRELGVLHDRDENGEFLHFYTAVYGGVFFEVVQRIGGYDGYGAGNAPVRLAAQHAYDAVS